LPGTPDGSLAGKFGHTDESEQAQEAGYDQGVQVKSPETVTDGQVGQVVDNVSTRRQCLARSHIFPLFDYCCLSSAIQ
jgi:hypothetical protein